MTNRWAAGLLVATLLAALLGAVSCGRDETTPRAATAAADLAGWRLGRATAAIR